MTFSLCFFNRELGMQDCDGRMDRAHLLPKQRMRQHGIKDVWDERTWVFACRKHHTQFDARFIRISRFQLPAGTIAYALENGLEWSLDRDYPNGKRIESTDCPECGSAVWRNLDEDDAHCRSCGIRF